MTATRIDRGSTNSTTVYSDGGDLTFERIFDAPRERVWKAFTNPELVPRWWGPHGTTTTVVEMEVRPGGTWRGCLVSTEDGRQLWLGGVYREVTPPERLVFTFAWEEGPAAGTETLVTITFAPICTRL